MKYYISHSNTNFPQGDNEFHYVERELYLLYDNVDHAFGISDFLTSYLKPCSGENIEEHIKLNSKYVILIYNSGTKKFEPIKQILER